MAAVAALVLFFSRPMLPGSANSGEARDVILVLDTSLSVSQETGDGTASSQGPHHGRAGGRISRLRRLCRVMEAGPSAPAVADPSALQAGSRGRTGVLTILNSLKPGSGTCRLTDALTEAVLARPAKEGLVRRILVFHGWTGGNAPAGVVAAWAAVRDAAASLRGGCVMEVVSQSARHRKCGRVRTAAVSREHGASWRSAAVPGAYKDSKLGSKQGPVSLRWTMDGAAAGLSTVPAIAPGASLSVELTRSCPPGPGASVFQCELEPPRLDALKGDEYGRRARGALAAGARAAGGWIAGAGSEGNRHRMDRGGMRSAEGEPSPFSLTTVPAGVLTNPALENVRAVILANPPLLAAGVLASLEDFVRNGGGLWILPGEQTHAAGPAFRQALFGQGRGLAPLLLTPPKGTAGDAAAAVRLRHPARIIR